MTSIVDSAILLDSSPQEERAWDEVAAQPRRAARRRGSGTGLRTTLFDLFNILPSVVVKPGPPEQRTPEHRNSIIPEHGTPEH